MTLHEKQRECPSCALEVNASAEVCPYCAYEFPRQKTGLAFWAVVMALLLAWPIFKLIRYLLS